MARKDEGTNGTAVLEAGTVDEAINVLSGVDPEAEKAEYRARLALALSEEERPMAMQPKVPKGVWTVDAMKHKEPAVADLYGDNEHLWHFMPLLQDTYCQLRYKKVEDIKGKYGSFVATQIAYAEIVWYCMDDPRCSWDLLALVYDEDGQPKMIIDEETGEPTDEYQTVPLPRTWDSVQLFDWDMLVDILNSFQRTISGETKGQR